MNIRHNLLSRISGEKELCFPRGEWANTILDTSLSNESLEEVLRGAPSSLWRVLDVLVFQYSRQWSKKPTIRDILSMLGERLVVNLALTALFRPFIREANSSYDLPPDDLWLHSVAVAVTAEELARVLQLEEPAHSYVSGLVHDIGKVLLGEYESAESSSITGMALRERVTIDIAERQVLGIDHGEAGAELLTSWGMPDSMIHTARWHHQPDRFDDPPLLLDLVHIANALTYACRIGPKEPGLIICPSCRAVESLKLTVGVAEEAAGRARVRLRELEDLL